MKKFFTILLLVLSANSFADYDRHEWLPRWSDFDRDCQNTRHELLIRYSMAPVTFTNERKCTVKTGLWLDPYSGQFYTLASDLDIEHVVALKWAHDHGGADWPLSKKRQFAEDPENLWVVQDRLNQQKSAQGPHEWLPPYAPARNVYLHRYGEIMKKYGLSFKDQK